MADRKHSDPDYFGSLRRVFLGIAVVVLLAIFLVWRIDNARVEQLRVNVVDRFVPNFEWTLRPVAATARMIGDFRSYRRVYEQNEELRREVQRMQGWREAALQLEQKNARLLALSNVRLNPRTTYVTAEVMADAGSPFRRSATVNIGAADGVEDGAAVVDGLGLVGRIAGVGERSARVIFLTDGSSRVPAVVLPSGQRVLVAGDNSVAPPIEFVALADEISAGDRVVSTGAGGLYPADLLIGRVVTDGDGRLRVRPAADYRQLDFVRVLRHAPVETIIGPGEMIGPLLAGQPETPEDGEIRQ